MLIQGDNSPPRNYVIYSDGHSNADADADADSNVPPRWSWQPAAGIRWFENIALDRVVKVRLGTLGMSCQGTSCYWATWRSVVFCLLAFAAFVRSSPSDRTMNVNDLFFVALTRNIKCFFTSTIFSFKKISMEKSWYCLIFTDKRVTKLSSGIIKNVNNWLNRTKKLMRSSLFLDHWIYSTT